MALSKEMAGGMLYRGGIFGAGVLCTILWRSNVLPKYMGVITLSITSIGLCSTIWHFLKVKERKGKSDADVKGKALYVPISNQADSSDEYNGGRSEDEVKVDGGVRYVDDSEIPIGDEDDWTGVLDMMKHADLRQTRRMKLSCSQPKCEASTSRGLDGDSFRDIRPFEAWDRRRPEIEKELKGLWRRRFSKRKVGRDSKDIKEALQRQCLMYPCFLY